MTCSVAAGKLYVANALNKVSGVLHRSITAAHADSGVAVFINGHRRPSSTSTRPERTYSSERHSAELV